MIMFKQSLLSGHCSAWSRPKLWEVTTTARPFPCANFYCRARIGWSWPSGTSPKQLQPHRRLSYIAWRLSQITSGRSRCLMGSHRASRILGVAPFGNVISLNFRVHSNIGHARNMNGHHMTSCPLKFFGLQISVRIGGSSPKDSSMAWSSVAVSLPSWAFMAGTIPKSRPRMWPGYSEMLGLTPTHRKEKDSGRES